MTPAEKLIHSEILTRCDNLNYKRPIAITQADDAIKRYREGRYNGKPSKLVTDAVANAKKINGKLKKDAEKSSKKSNN